jgi:hypothetical protein
MTLCLVSHFLVVMLNFPMLSVIMLSVTMLNVVMLSVVAPQIWLPLALKVNCENTKKFGNLFKKFFLIQFDPTVLRYKLKVTEGHMK